MKLNEKHMRIIKLHCGDGVMATREELAKLAGVSRRTVQRVFAEPEAREIIRELTNTQMAVSRPAVIERMTRDAIKGDSSARRDYLQTGGDIGTGGHITNVSVTQNNNEDLDDRAADIWTRRAKALTQDEG